MTANAPWQGIGLTLMIGIIALAPPLTRTRLSYAGQTREADGIHALIPPLPDWLTFAGQFEIETTRQQNFNLTPPKSDTRTTIRPEIELVFGAFFPNKAFEAGTSTAFFAQFRLQVQF